MPEVHFARQGIKVQVPMGTSIREAAKRIKLPLEAGVFRLINCYGHGVCGECCVIVMEGAENLTPVTEGEETYKRPRNLRQQTGFGLVQEDGERLACQARVLGDVKVWTHRRKGLPPEHLGGATS